MRRGRDLLLAAALVFERWPEKWQKYGLGSDVGGMPLAWAYLRRVGWYEVEQINMPGALELLAPKFGGDTAKRQAYELFRRYLCRIDAVRVEVASNASIKEVLFAINARLDDPRIVVEILKAAADEYDGRDGFAAFLAAHWPLRRIRLRSAQ